MRLVHYVVMFVVLAGTMAGEFYLLNQSTQADETAVTEPPATIADCGAGHET